MVVDVLDTSGVFAKLPEQESGDDTRTILPRSS
jgi:hypothetical protein